MGKIRVLISDNHTSSKVLASLLAQYQNLDVLALHNIKITECIGPELINNNKINWHNIDPMDVFEMDTFLDEVDTLIHLANHRHFDPIADTGELEESIRLTEEIVNASLKAGVNKIVYLSSALIMKNKAESAVLDEESEFLHNSDSDILSALYRAEQQIWRAWAEGVNVTIIQPSLIINPESWYNSASELIRYLHYSKKSVNNNLLAFVDIRDVVKAIVNALNQDFNNERYILSSESISISDLKKKCSGDTGTIPVLSENGLNWYSKLRNRIVPGNSVRLSKSQQCLEILDLNLPVSGQKAISSILDEYIPLDESLNKLFSHKESTN